MQPRVGFISVGGELYDPGLIREVYKRCREALAGSSLEVIAGAPPILFSAGETRLAAERFRDKDIDLLLILFCSWAPEDILLQLANELPEISLLLWALTRPDQLVSSCGLLSAASNFKRQGRRFHHVLGDPGRETLSRIERISRACSVGRRLRRSRIGIVGYPPHGMIDVTFSEGDLLKIGPVLVHIDTIELLDAYERARPEEAEEVASRVGSSGCRINLAGEELVESARMYCGLRDLVMRYDLDALGVRCWPELREERKVPVCFGLSRLSDEGITGFCENDVNKAVVQLAMQWMTGLPAFLGDPSVIDFNANTMVIWHCGALGTRAASSNGEVRVERNVFSGRGVGMCFSLREGPVTVASLAGPVDGEFNFLACGGEALAGTPESGNQATVRFELPLNHLFDRMVENGMGHHLVVGSGDVVGELKDLAAELGLQSVL
jgi:L-fucose isomerase-like protein